MFRYSIKVMEYIRTMSNGTQTDGQVRDSNDQVAQRPLEDDQVTRQPYVDEELLDMDHDGATASEVNESLLNESDEQEAIKCTGCGIQCIDYYATFCKVDNSHNYCPWCTYQLMKESKYCPSGKKCKKVGKAGP